MGAGAKMVCPLPLREVGTMTLVQYAAYPIVLLLFGGLGRWTVSFDSDYSGEDGASSLFLLQVSSSPFPICFYWGIGGRVEDTTNRVCMYYVGTRANKTTPAHVGRHVSLAFASISGCHGEEEETRKTVGKDENPRRSPTCKTPASWPSSARHLLSSPLLASPPPDPVHQSPTRCTSHLSPTM